MIVLRDIEQGSPGWYAARAGVPSASCFGKIVTTKGAPSKQRRDYMLTLAGETLAGEKEATYESRAMSRGIETEPEARAFYEFTSGVDVEEVGLCYPDERKLCSCSPDGLVGEDGGLEIKCPMMAAHVCNMLSGSLPAVYFQQVQGSLYITGRKWWDFFSYHPSLPPVLVRVERDEDFISKLAVELERFATELAAMVCDLRGKYFGSAA